MDPIRIILRDTFNTAHNKELFEKSPLEQRVAYLRNLSSINKAGEIASIYENDDKLCYSVVDVQMHLNNKLYTKYKTRHGFTFDKTTKKLKPWFGFNIKELLKNHDNNLRLCLKYLKMDWFLNMPTPYKRLMTKTVFGYILSGKITNPEDYIKKCISVSFKTNKIHWRLFKECLDSNFPSVIYNISRYIKHTTNPNETIKIMLSLLKNDDDFFNPNHHLSILNDTIANAEILGVKINSKWSIKRLEIEHNKMMKEINSYLIKEKTTTPILYGGLNNIIFPKDTILLDNELGIYNEATIMHHCIYTNYWKDIRDKNYFCLRMTSPERCTIGIKYSNIKKYFYIDQMYLAYNKSVKSETRNIIEEWLQQDVVQEFFKSNMFNTFAISLNVGETEREVEIEELEMELLPF